MPTRDAGRGHRYKDLTVFDLSDLALVGIDYNDLDEGVETPCRFWAHYTHSDKLNGNGNPYKDVAGLEPFAPPTEETDPDVLATILAACLRPPTEGSGELRAIRALLTAHLGAEPPETTSPRVCTGERRYADCSPMTEGNPAEEKAFDAFLKQEGRPPSSISVLREWLLQTKGRDRRESRASPERSRGERSE